MFDIWSHWLYPIYLHSRSDFCHQVIGATLQLGGQNVLSPSQTRIRPTATRARPTNPSKTNFGVPTPTRKNYGPVVGSALPVERVEVEPPKPGTQRGVGKVGGLTDERKPNLTIQRRPSTTSTSSPRAGPTRRPRVPAVRIDTCIVGNDATCKEEHFEVSATSPNSHFVLIHI